MTQHKNTERLRNFIRVTFLAFLGTLAKLLKVKNSFVMFVRPFVCPRGNSTPIGRIFMKSDIWGFLEKLSRKFEFH